MKTITIENIEFKVLKYNECMVIPVIEYYQDGLGSPICLSLLSCEGDHLELYTTITVNLPDQSRKAGCQFIDTNNNGDEILGWLEENKFGKPTGNTGYSGFCEYPEFNFYIGENFRQYKVLWDKINFPNQF